MLLGACASIGCSPSRSGSVSGSSGNDTGSAAATEARDAGSAKDKSSRLTAGCPSLYISTHGLWLGNSAGTCFHAGDGSDAMGWFESELVRLRPDEHWCRSIEIASAPSVTLRF